MKTRLILIAIMLCFGFGMWGKQTQGVSAQNQLQQTSVEQLQKENEELQEQMDVVEINVEKQVEKFRADVRTNLAIWFSVLTVIMALLGAVLGIIMPNILNSKNEKNMQKKLEEATTVAELAKSQAESANQQAETTASQAASIANQFAEAVNGFKAATDALETIEQLKIEIDKIKDEIDKSKKSANRAAKEAKVSELLSLAQSEKDPHAAIEHYTAAIHLSPNDPLLYEKRSELRTQINDTVGAEEDSNKAKYLIQKENDYKESQDYLNMGDFLFATGKYKDAVSSFTKALKLKINEKDILLKRAECYQRLSEQELDEEKKEYYLNKAIADTDRANRL